MEKAQQPLGKALGQVEQPHDMALEGVKEAEKGLQLRDKEQQQVPVEEILS